MPHAERGQPAVGFAGLAQVCRVQVDAAGAAVDLRHAAYATRRARIMRRLADDLSPWFELVPATADIHQAALCKRPLDVAQLISLARRVDVGLYPLDAFTRAYPLHLHTPKSEKMKPWSAEKQ